MNGGAWYGMLPPHWLERPLYAVASERRMSNKGLRETNLLSLSYGRIVRKDIKSSEGLLPTSFETYQIVEPGDVVLRLTDLQNDQRSLRSGLVAEKGIITSAYLALRMHGAEPRFIAYQLRAIDSMKIFYSMGGGLRQTIGYDDLKRLHLPLPPLEEQRAIAGYLDRETAQIDVFIAKNEELIGLLTERRASTIGRAVTSGIDPGRRLNEVKEGWLRPIPNDWRVAKIKDIGKITLGKMLQERPVADSDALMPYLRAASVQPDGVMDLTTSKEMWFSTRERQSLNLKSGDVVIVEGGVGGYGRAAYIASDLPGVGFQNSIVRVRPHAHVDGRFLTYALLHLRTIGYIEMVASVASMPHFTAEKVAATLVPFPALAEQTTIADFLDSATETIDRAIVVARRAVGLARERRAALISAAVTGKIDVGVAA